LIPRIIAVTQFQEIGYFRYVIREEAEMLGREVWEGAGEVVLFYRKALGFTV
jgi:hypothetical protein